MSALLLTLLAFGPTPPPPDPNIRQVVMNQRVDRRDRLGSGATSAFQYLPLALSGPLIPEDGNTVMHCVADDYNGTTLTCRRGGAWTTNGSVTGAATPPLYPNGFGGSARNAMGPFSDTNNLQLGTGVDVLDITGDFTVCTVFTPTTNTTQALISDGTAASTAGWAVIQADTSGTATMSFESWSPTSSSQAKTSNVTSTGGPSVFCGGRAGLTLYGQLNLGALASAAITATASSGLPAYIGRYGATGIPFTGQIYEVYVSTTTPTAGLLTTLQETALTELGTRGEPMTFTRTATQTYLVNGVMYVAASGAPAFGAAGIQIENSATNSALWNRDLTNAVWTATSATVAKTATGVDGVANSASTATATATNATVLQVVTAGATARSTSMWLRRRTGSGVVNVTHNGGSNWTAAALSGSWSRFDQDTNSNLNGNIANPSVGIQITTSGDAVDVDYVQDETGSYATSAIVTQGTTATRDPTITSFPNPLSGAVNQDFCMGAAVTPIDFWNYLSVGAAMVIGPHYATANTSSLFMNLITNSLNFEVYDGAGALKKAAVVNPFTFLNSTPHALRGCSVGGNLSLWVDGVLQSPTITGAGTGTIATMPSNLQIGSAGDASRGNFIQVSNVCISKNAAGCK